MIVYHRLGSTTFSDTVDSTVAELLKRERVYSSEEALSFYVLCHEDPLLSPECPFRNLCQRAFVVRVSCWG